MKTRFLISVFSFLLSAFVWATGGVGFVNLCTPANIGSLQGWWKANTYTVADGTAVGGTGKEWKDQSGNGKDGANATGALQPVFHTSVFGSSPGVQFAADNTVTTQNYLDTSAGNVLNSITTSGDWTLFCVHISDATGSSSVQSCIGGNAYAGGTQVLSLNSGNATFTLKDEGIIDNDVSATLSSTTGQALCGVFGSWAGKSSFYENKTSRTVAGQNYGTFKYNFIGACATPSNNRLNGKIGELVIMFKKPSVSQILTLYGSYWRPRFTTLPGN